MIMITKDQPGIQIAFRIISGGESTSDPLVWPGIRFPARHNTFQANATKKMGI